MAKEITGYVKLQIKGGQANPAPPVGPALGQRGINIMEFCKAFNEKTKTFMGKPVPVVITVYKDKKFDFIIKSNFLFLYTVIITGTGLPIKLLVFSLKALQNSIIFIPRWPKAGPTGGAGFAWPPFICNLTYPVISFSILMIFLPGYILIQLEWVGQK